MSNWGLDTDLLNKVKEDSVATVSAGYQPLASGIYACAIDKMYISTTASGAEMLNINFKIEENGKLIFTKYCIRSSAEKGSKATFTIRADHPEFLKSKWGVGNEAPLPDWEKVQQLFDSVKTTMAENAPEDGMIKVGDNTVPAKIFKTMIGKQLHVCGQVQESEYNGNVSEDFVPVVFLDVQGNNANGEPQEEKFLKKIAKEPVKRLKKKAAPTAAFDASGPAPF